ncbi:scytalone dehydratase, partial [Colletotrichum incanum]
LSLDNLNHMYGLMMTSAETLCCTWADEQAFRKLSFKWSIAWDRKDISTWLEIATPEIIADYTDYPAVGVLRQGDSEEFFKSSFSNTGLGDPRLVARQQETGRSEHGISESSLMDELLNGIPAHFVNFGM